MKKCSGCNELKQSTEFAHRNKLAGTLQTRCRACVNSYMHSYYRRNKRRYSARRDANRTVYRHRNQAIVLAYLAAHPCEDCGEDDVRVLEFDHVRDRKCTTVSDLIRNGKSVRLLAAEIAKCMVRCANCHRRKTARDFDWYKNRLRAKRCDESHGLFQPTLLDGSVQPAVLEGRPYADQAPVV